MKNGNPIFIVAREVAELIGFNSANHFLNHRDRLEEEEAFPPPMPTSRQPLKWRADEVKAWSNRHGKSQ